MRAVDQVVHEIYLILQQEPLSFFKKGQSLIHKFRFIYPSL